MSVLSYRSDRVIPPGAPPRRAWVALACGAAALLLDGALCSGVSRDWFPAEQETAFWLFVTFAPLTALAGIVIAVTSFGPPGRPRSTLPIVLSALGMSAGALLGFAAMVYYVFTHLPKC